MTRPEFLKGFAVFAIVMGTAWLSMPYVDRYVDAVASVKAAIPEIAANRRRAAGHVRAERWLLQELAVAECADAFAAQCAPEKYRLRLRPFTLRTH